MPTKEELLARAQKPAEEKAAAVKPKKSGGASEKWLGLTIVEKMVQRMNGVLEISNATAPDHGLVVRIRLRRAPRRCAACRPICAIPSVPATSLSLTPGCSDPSESRVSPASGAGIPP